MRRWRKAWTRSVAAAWMGVGVGCTMIIEVTPGERNDTTGTTGPTSSTGSGGIGGGGGSAGGGGNSTGGGGAGGMGGAVATCSDHTKNQDETDVDCGGATCSACAVGKSCLVNSDCVDDFCDPTGKICSIPPCSDSTKNQDETDVDCGGAICIEKCDFGKSCIVDGDCAGDFCDPTSKICSIPTCGDGAASGMETDVDCGGPCPVKCGPGLKCNVSSDCEGNECHGIKHTCIPNCVDKAKTGTETDTDCGGSPVCGQGCPTCAIGKGCLQGLDCTSGHCMGGACVEAGKNGDACLANLDCASGRCAGNQCAPWGRAMGIGNGTRAVAVSDCGDIFVGGSLGVTKFPPTCGVDPCAWTWQKKPLPGVIIIDTIAVDKQGDVYFGGNASGQIHCENDVVPAPGNSAYVAKLSGFDGKCLWAKAFSATGGNLFRVTSVAVDSSDNVYAAGWYGANSVDFGPRLSDNVPQLFPGGSAVGFLAKIPQIGNDNHLVAWAKFYPTKNSVQAVSLRGSAIAIVPGSEDVVIGGRFDDVTDFSGNGASVDPNLVIAPVGKQGFVLRVLPSGDTKWVRHEGDITTAVAVSASGDIFYTSISNPNDRTIVGAYDANGMPPPNWPLMIGETNSGAESIAVDGTYLLVPWWSGTGWTGSGICNPPAPCPPDMKLHIGRVDSIGVVFANPPIETSDFTFGRTDLGEGPGLAINPKTHNVLLTGSFGAATLELGGVQLAGGNGAASQQVFLMSLGTQP